MFKTDKTLSAEHKQFLLYITAIDGEYFNLLVKKGIDAIELYTNFMERVTLDSNTHIYHSMAKYTNDYDDDYKCRYKDGTLISYGYDHYATNKNGNDLALNEVFDCYMDEALPLNTAFTPNNGILFQYFIYDSKNMHSHSPYYLGVFYNPTTNRFEYQKIDLEFSSGDSMYGIPDSGYWNGSYVANVDFLQLFEDHPSIVYDMGCDSRIGWKNIYKYVLDCA